MNVVFLEIGGNLGNRLLLLAQAKKAIEQTVGKIVCESSVYESEAWGFEAASNFYNRVLQVETNCNAEEVLRRVNVIEAELGRIRGKEQFISRTMDIDILLFNTEVVDLPKLKIPHPRIRERKFVLMPLCEIIPKQMHPEYKLSFEQLLNTCPDTGKCWKVE